MKKIVLTTYCILIALFCKAQFDFTRLHNQMLQENYKEALKIADSCIVNKLQEDSALYFKGIILIKLNKVRDANKVHKTLVKVYPEFKDAHYLGGLIAYNQDDFGRSADEFTRAIRHQPNHVKALYNRSLASGMLEDYLYAIEDLDKCISEQPNNSLYYYSRAYWYEYTGNHAAAEKDYKKCIAIDSKYYDAYYGLAYIYQNQKEFIKACDVIHDAKNAGSQVADDMKNNFCK